MDLGGILSRAGVAAQGYREARTANLTQAAALEQLRLARLQREQQEQEIANEATLRAGLSSVASTIGGLRSPYTANLRISDTALAPAPTAATPATSTPAPATATPPPPPPPPPAPSRSAPTTATATAPTSSAPTSAAPSTGAQQPSGADITASIGERDGQRTFFYQPSADYPRVFIPQQMLDDERFRNVLNNRRSEYNIEPVSGGVIISNRDIGIAGRTAEAIGRTAGAIVGPISAGAQGINRLIDEAITQPIIGATRAVIGEPISPPVRPVPTTTPPAAGSAGIGATTPPAPAPAATSAATPAPEPATPSGGLRAGASDPAALARGLADVPTVLNTMQELNPGRQITRIEEQYGTLKQLLDVYIRSGREEQAIQVMETMLGLQIQYDMAVGLDGISRLQAGDPRVIESFLADQTGVLTDINPVLNAQGQWTRSYQVSQGGTIIEQNISADDLSTFIRTQFDSAFQQEQREAAAAFAEAQLRYQQDVSLAYVEGNIRAQLNMQQGDIDYSIAELEAARDNREIQIIQSGDRTFVRAGDRVFEAVPTTVDVPTGGRGLFGGAITEQEERLVLRPVTIPIPNPGT